MSNFSKVLMFFLIVPLFSFSQNQSQPDTLWKTSGNVTLNFSQVSLTNWAAGGSSSGSGVLMIKLAGNYKNEKVSWDNSADLRLGFLKEGDQDMRKSDDMIDLNSKLGIEAKEHWYYSFVLGFKSQFAEGYNYPDTENLISKFMAPGYLNTGLGMDYKTEKLSVLMAPLSGKFTFVMDDKLSDDGAFGVDPGKKSRAELGATVKMEYKTPLVKNVDLETNLDLFSSYLDKPQNIDVDWKVLINMKINDWLSANLATRLIYDDDILIDIDDNDDGEPDRKGRRVQFMEMFGAGISIKF